MWLRLQIDTFSTTGGRFSPIAACASSRAMQPTTFAFDDGETLKLVLLEHLLEILGREIIDHDRAEIGDGRNRIRLPTAQIARRNDVHAHGAVLGQNFVVEVVFW